ncbi:GntR family transcriptional regulator [Leucobacter sp. GX0328]
MPLDRAMTAVEVSEAIWDQANADGLGPGDRIGAERELSARYGVSRWVVRKALEQLENQERVLRTNGRNGGVFLARSKVMRDLGGPTALPEYVQPHGLAVGVTVLGTATIIADVRLAALMEVREGIWLLQVDRIRLVGDQPLSLETTWLRADLFPNLLNRSLQGSLVELLETEYGLVRGEAVETISARPAAREHLAPLQVSAGTPILEVTRAARMSNGEIYEYSEERFRADRTEMVLRSPAGGGTVRRFIGRE